MTRTTLSLLSLLAVLPMTACSSLNFGGRRSVSLEDAPAVLAEAEQSLAAGDHLSALADLKLLFKVEGLPTTQRNRVSQLFSAAAELQINELSASSDGADELADFVDEELPREIAVSAGIAAARAFSDRGEAEETWKILRRLDERFPLHHERATAGRLLVEAGLSLSHDDRSWWLFWSARAEGQACLEYVVLNHPAQPRCDEAYMRLGELYGEDNQRLLAIERFSDLVLYHPDSRLRPLAQAQIPMLRLGLLDSPEYDRNGLLLALSELDDWVVRFPSHPMLDEVLHGRLDALRRLSASDLGIARFYVRIGNSEGTRFHARRAQELATTAGDEHLAASARELLSAPAPADS